MDVSDDDVWTKPAQRAAQANAKKAIEKLFNDENEEVNCDYESPQTEVEELEDPEPSCFVNVEVKVEVNDEGSDVEEQESVDSSNTFLNISDPKSFTSEGTSKAKTIVAKFPEAELKLNAVVAPRPTDSLLECLEPEVSMATEDSITSGGLHACPWCTMSFMSLQFLEEHKKHYHQVSSRKSNQQSKSPELHTCEECGKTFAQSWCLKRHYIIHTGLRPFICVDCGEAFATGGELSFHQKSHVIQTLYKCIECEETFKSSNELRYHMIMHAPHICLICGERFFEEHLLHAHSQTHTIDRCWMCLHCDRGFSSQEILLTHQRNHTIEKQEQSEFVCDRCGKDFTKKENLEAHLKAHAEFRLCELCYLVFPNTAHMRMHMRGRHKVDPPKPYAELFRKGSYICLDCYKHFRFVNALKRHIRTSHSLAKTYKCDECGECFHDPTGLKGHLKVHTSWRPPYCHKCGERLKKDDWSVHMCSGQVLYECHVCGKSFFTNRSWKEHMKSHEGRNVVRTGDSTTADGTYFPSRSDHVIFIPETAKDSNAFRASIADKLKGTGFFTEKRNEADNFKDKIAGRLMGTGFVAEKKNEVNNFRDTIAERLKETGMLSFGNGKVSLSLLKFEKE